jgi:nucleotide-binding universal stress UspA family protein
LPVLAQCEGRVGVFTAPEKGRPSDADEVLEYLAWHGIDADLAVEEARPIGASLLARAAANQSALIVMGAYTHGHFRQFFFGGVTRHVMKHADVPVLLAH